MDLVRDPLSCQAVPLCAADIVAAPAIYSDAGDSAAGGTWYKIGRRRFQRADLIGLCRSVIEYDNFFKCQVDDGTNTLGCTLWKPRLAQPIPSTSGYSLTPSAMTSVTASTLAGSATRSTFTHPSRRQQQQQQQHHEDIPPLDELQLSDLLLSELSNWQQAVNQPHIGASLHVRGKLQEFRNSRELSCNYYRVCQPIDEMRRHLLLRRLHSQDSDAGYRSKFELPDQLIEQLRLSACGLQQETAAADRLLQHLRSSQLHQFTQSDLLLNADWLTAATAVSPLQSLIKSGLLRAWVCQETGRHMWQLVEADACLKKEVLHLLRILDTSGRGVTEFALLGQLRQQSQFTGIGEQSLKRVMDRLLEESRVISVGPRSYSCV